MSILEPDWWVRQQMERVRKEPAAWRSDTRDALSPPTGTSEALVGAVNLMNNLEHAKARAALAEHECELLQRRVDELITLANELDERDSRRCITIDQLTQQLAEARARLSAYENPNVSK